MKVSWTVLARAIARSVTSLSSVDSVSFSCFRLRLSSILTSGQIYEVKPEFHAMGLDGSANYDKI